MVDSKRHIDIEELKNNPNLDFLSKHNDSDETEASPYYNIDVACPYLDENEFLEKHGKNKDVSLLSLNVQSLNAKFSSLREFIDHFKCKNFNFDIMALQEIYQIEDPSLFNIPGYAQLVYKDRKNGHGGGVGYYVNSKLKFSVRDDLSIFIEGICECLFIEIELSNKKKVIIGNFYRPPSKKSKSNDASVANKLKLFQESLYQLLTSCKKDNMSNIYLVGDFNLCLLRHDLFEPTAEFIDLMFSFGFIEIITKPTRVCHHSTYTSYSLIDHIWTDRQTNVFNSGIITSYVSDHFPIFTFINNSKKGQAPPKFIESRDFSEENILRFRNFLENTSFERVKSEDDPEKCLEVLDDMFFSIYDFHFPKKTTKLNRNIHRIEKWITGGIMKSRQTKIKLRTKLLKHPSQENKEIFKKYKNLYNKIIRARKKAYYSEMLIEFKGNLKKCWSLMREASGTEKKKLDITDFIKVDGMDIKGDQNIAEHFNTHFSTITAKLKEKITPTNTLPESFLEEENFTFSFPDVTPDLVIATFNQLQIKKSTDWTGLSTSFMKKVINQIADPLAHLFNRSFITGIVPNKFKIAKVSPVLKGGDPTNIDNYRPISLLSIFSKIHEKIVANVLKSHLYDNEIIHQNQFGFQEKNSTFHPMIHLLDTIGEAMNRKKYSLAIFCDLSKAFDMVPIDSLLIKLEKIGIRGRNLKWFENYLRGRTQFVRVRNNDSSYENMYCGIPQGSILGPILFLIFFNDLPRSTLLKVLLFADDTTLIATGNNLTELINFVNKELQKISVWFRANQMMLHPNKTVYTIFHPKPSNIPWDDIHIYIDENEPGTKKPDENLKKPLPFINHKSIIPAVKFLGVYFDPALNFKYHISQLHKKLSKALFILRRSKNILSQKALKSLYYTTFHSHLLYANIVYSCATDTALKSIKILQKKAIRIISNSNYNAHTSPLFKSLKIMPLESITKFTKLQILYDYKTGNLPKSFDNKWCTVEERINRAPLRNSDLFDIPYCRIDLVKRLPNSCIPTAWNNFHKIRTKNETSRKAFNCNLKLDLLNDLETNCQRENCHECQNS